MKVLLFLFFQEKNTTLQFDLAEGEIVTVVDAFRGLGRHGLGVGITGRIGKFTARYAGTGTAETSAFTAGSASPAAAAVIPTAATSANPTIAAAAVPLALASNTPHPAPPRALFAQQPKYFA